MPKRRQDLSLLKATLAKPAVEFAPREMKALSTIERNHFVKFAIRHSEPGKREIFRQLYAWWFEYNSRFFADAMRPPHITFGITPPRVLGFSASCTDWGAKEQITLNRRLIDGRHVAVINSWPSEGVKRFVADTLLHEMIHQWQNEILQNREAGYRGHGPHFAKKCNEIGRQIYIVGDVVPKRRHGCEQPSCAYWPSNVRPDGYYCGDIDESRFRRKKPKHVPTFLRVFEELLEMLQCGHVKQAIDFLETEIESANIETQVKKA